MADHYLKFSEVLDLSSDAVLREQQTTWINKVLNAYSDSENLDTAKSILEANGIDAKEVDIEYWCDFCWNIESDPVLWIYSEEHANVYNVGLFVRAFMNKFDIPGVWTLQWSETCSSPRIGAFSGGAMLVDKKNILMKSIREVMDDMRVSLQNEKAA